MACIEGEIRERVTLAYKGAGNLLQIYQEHFLEIVLKKWEEQK